MRHCALVVPSGQRAEDVEQESHRLPKVGKHTRQKRKVAGREWLVTSIPFVDEIATILKLEVEEVSPRT